MTFRTSIWRRMMSGKRCSRCERALPLHAFATRRASHDGLQNWCRPCTSAWAREKRPRKRAVAPETASDQKWCRRCDSVKALDTFGPHRGTRDGRQTYCRTCFADIYRPRRTQAGFTVRPAQVPDGHKYCRRCDQSKPTSEWLVRAATTDGYSFRCADCMRRYVRDTHLASTYGLTDDDVAKLLARQDGRCAICLTAEAIHIDHNHATGRIRGMLCFRCNAALGQLGDDPSVVRRAADYLEGRMIRMRRIHPAYVQILYPSPPQAWDPPARFRPQQPPLDIAELRRLAAQG